MMKSLHIGLGPEPGAALAAEAASSIILAKALVYDDYRSAYAGAELCLLGACVERAYAESGFDTRFLGADETGFIVGRDARDRNRRLLDLVDRFADSVGGYGGLEEAFDLLALARLDRFSDPLAFFAASAPRLRFEAFLARVERAGHLPADRLALSIFEVDIPPLASPRRSPSGIAMRSAYFR
jgi:hypothetical protein